MTLKLGDYCVQSGRLAKYCFDPPLYYTSMYNNAHGIIILGGPKDNHFLEPGIRKWSLSPILENRETDHSFKIKKFQTLLQYIQESIDDTELKYPAQKKFITEALEWGLRTL